jgi:hypothetical protein
MNCTTDRVFAADGTPSLLYSQLVEDLGGAQALRAYLYIQMHGMPGPHATDSSGEPTIDSVKDAYPALFSGIYARPKAKNRDDGVSREEAHRHRILTEQIEALRARLKGKTSEKDKRKIIEHIRALSKLRSKLAIVGGARPSTFKEVAEAQLKAVLKMANEFSENYELEHALEVAESWKTAITYKSLSNERRSGDNAVAQVFSEIGALADNVHRQLLHVARLRLIDRIEEDTGRTVTLDSVMKIADISGLKKNVQDLSETGNMLAMHADALLKDGARSWAERANRISQELLELSKGVDVDRLLQKDEKGNKEMALVTEFSRTFFKEKGMIEGVLKKALEKSYELSEAARQSYVEAALFDYYEAMDKIEVSLDVRFFIPVEEGGKTQTGKFDSKEEYIAWLEKSVGKEKADSLIEQALELYNTYKRDLEVEERAIREEVLAGNWSPNLKDDGTLQTQEEYIAFRIATYKNDVSPLSYLTQKGGEGKSFNEYSRGDQYVVTSPRRFDAEGKQTEYYDDAYTKLSKKERELYDYILKTMEELKSYLPAHIADSLGENFLPIVHKNWIERLSENGVADLIKHSKKELKDSILVKSTSSILPIQQDEGVNPMTGKVRERPPIRYIYDRDVDTIKAEIEKAENKKKDPKTPAEQQPQIDKRIQLLKEELVKAENKEDISFDIVKAVEMFSAMALNYHYISAVQDEVSLVRTVIQNATVPQAEGGQPIVRDGEQEDTKLSPANLLAAFDNATMVLVEGKRSHKDEHQVEIVMGKDKKDRIRRREIQEKMKELEKQKDNLEISQEAYDEQMILLGEEWDLLEGRAISMGNVLKNLLIYVQTKAMGWNLPAGMMNMAFGFVSNFTHAAGEQDFTEEHARTAFSIVWTANKSTSTSKAAHVMQKLGVLFEIQDLAAGENRARIQARQSSGHKMLSHLKPYEIQRRTEFYIQGHSVVAQMLATEITTTDKKGNKVVTNLWEALDSKGNWREDLNVPAEWNPQREAGSARNDFAKFRDKAIQVNKRLHGNYDVNSPIGMRSHIVGQAVLQFRRWIIAGVATRFERSRPDTLLGRDVKGRYISIIEGVRDQGFTPTFSLAFSTLIRGSMIGKAMGAEKITEAEGFSDEDLANIRMAMKEMRIYLYIAMTMLALGFDLDDDEDEGVATYGKRVLFQEMGRVASDISLYLVPGEFADTVNNPASVLGVFEDFGRVWTSTQKYYLNEEYRGKHPAYHAGKTVPFVNQWLRIYRMATEDPR